MEGEAARVITGLPLTNTNYAVDLLKGRYGQSDRLLDTPKPVNNLPSLLSFHDTIEGHIHCLESLDKSPDSLETLLIPIMLGKQEYVQSSEWTVAQLQRAILRETRIFEAGHQISNPAMQNRLPTTSFFTSAGSNQRPRDHTSKQPVCAYCKGSHNSTSCEVHKDQPSHIAIIKQEKLCFNCLAHHRVSQCSSKNRC